MPNPTVPAAAPGLPTPVFTDQGALVESLYRICGLVEAIFAISESEASEQIRESALDGVQRALKREAEDLLHAEEVGELVVSPSPAAAMFAPRRGGLAAAIERHRAAGGAMDADQAGDPPPALIEAEDDALDALAALPCDDAQFIKKLRYMLADHRRIFGKNHRSSRADEILSALDLHFDGPARQSVEPAPDPVFAILEEWCRLNAAHLAAIKETDRLVTSDAAEEAQTRACLAVGKFEREVLLEARPTTPAGAVALLRAIAEWIGEIKDAECAPAILAAAAVLEREARR
jgi:hypothetical protein